MYPPKEERSFSDWSILYDSAAGGSDTELYCCPIYRFVQVWLDGWWNNSVVGFQSSGIEVGRKE